MQKNTSINAVGVKAVSKGEFSHPLGQLQKHEIDLKFVDCV